MSEEITREVFEHMVQLAALELSEEEAEYLRKELNNQLNAIHELEAVPLEDDIPLSSHGIQYTSLSSPPLREDEWEPYSDPDAIIEQAPEADERYVVVPEIPHEELE